MKKLWVLFVMFIITIFAYSQDVTVSNESQSTVAILLENWGVILLALMAFLKVIVNLVPTSNTVKIFGYIDSFITIFAKDIKKK